MQVGSVRTEDRTFRRYAFRLPYVKAGQAYELVLQGLTPNTAWYASLIDSVILKKVNAQPAAFDGQAFASTVVALAAGTALELDYGGTAELDGVSYGGSGNPPVKTYRE